MNVRYKEPPWGAWMFEAFTEDGMAALRRAHESLRANTGLDRHARCSTEDLATAAVELFRAIGRVDLLRDIP